MELSAGDWSIGSDALCDILLSDTSPRQATLQVREDGSAFLVPAAGVNNNQLQGEDIAENGADVPPYTCISLGEVHVAIGSADQGQWPNIEIPHKKIDSDENNDSVNNPEDKEKSATAHTTPDEQKLELNPQGQGPLAFLGSKKVILRLVLLILLFTLCVGGIWTANSPSEIELQRENIDAILFSQNATGLDVSYDKQGAWTIRGSVDNSQTQEVLEQALQGLPFEIITNFVALDDLSQSMQARIDAEGATLQARTLQGAVRVYGYIYDEKVLAELFAPLKEEMARAQIRKDIAYYEQTKGYLEENLLSAGLQDVVKLTAGPYSIVLETTGITQDKRAKLREFIQKTTDMTRGISPFVEATQKPAPQQAVQINSSMDKVEESSFCKSLTFGGLGAQLHVIFQNKSYARGTYLPNGLQVQDIREKYTTFIQGDRLFYCPR